MPWKNPIDASRWNWTGPRIDPKTKKLQFLSTQELVQVLAAGLPDGYEMYSGTDEYGDYVGYRAVSGLPDSGSTENSTYPRSENRETTTSGLVKQANWSPEASEVHGLRAVARIMSFAADGKAIVGQFHAEREEPPVKVQALRLKKGDEGYVEGKQLYRLVPQHRPFYNGAKATNDGQEVKEPVGPAWEVAGPPFDYDFNVTQNWKFNFQSGGDKYTDQFNADSYKKYDPLWYRKAGMYSQTKATTGTGVGDIRFYKLEMYDTLAVEPPVVVTPPTQPQPDAPRTVATLSTEVAAQLAGFKAGTIDKAAALAEIQDLKIEADTAFEKSAERSRFYTEVTAAKEAIRGGVVPPVVTPPTPTPTTEGDRVEAELNALLGAYVAGAVDLKSAKATLNKLGDRIDALPDGAEQSELYALADDVRNQLK